MVLKRGAGSGLTVGRLNNLRSIVRHPSTHSYSESVTSPSGVGYSMELAVFPPPTSRALQYSGNRARPFGSVGDRGAVVVNGDGGIVGMLLGGSGISSLSRSTRDGSSSQRKWEDEPEEFDISYVSDIRCLKGCLEECMEGGEVDLYPSADDLS
ncbi:hypothetical protein SISNIDRAFT_452121 [Sistotremastrum niveocremeum HHB9708]|uniref:Uncharacterized protein n=1 Tax=Sistotremastrum niveocremeum HHB9708 TaxID=1314777 RepID=A0A164WYU1_9AGAM|nr:hypothetical protein SISNIDRAFT_452121 [Sistotremastrum niveocremeum HHB9708]